MQVTLKDTLINVIIIRKNNKNIYFRFNENLDLVVTAPKLITKKEILRLITKNEKSLTNMFLKNQRKQNKKNEFWYLGQKYDVKFTNTNELEFDCGVLKVENQKALDKFLKQKIKEIFTREVNNYQNIIITPPFTLKFRYMKTRWGVCNYQKRTITLNTELIKYPLEALRYVIVHEMCHFEHHNHSQAFWEKVAKYYPNYKLVRKELKY